MWSRKACVSALFAAGMVGAAAVPLPSLADVAVELNFGPPPARYEVVPAPRSGYVWAPGYWHWDGRRHVWRSGHWEADRPGYVYVQPNWVERNGRWQYSASRWDRDGDGIPNRRDPTPNGNPRWDRDGDGVANRYDARPDNPYRQ